MRKIILFIILSLLAASSFAQTQPAAMPKMNVAILIFDGVQIIDYTGPYEVLGSHGKRKV